MYQSKAAELLMCVLGTVLHIVSILSPAWTFILTASSQIMGPFQLCRYSEDEFHEKISCQSYDDPPWTFTRIHVLCYFAAVLAVLGTIFSILGLFKKLDCEGQLTGPCLILAGVSCIGSAMFWVYLVHDPFEDRYAYGWAVIMECLAGILLLFGAILAFNNHPFRLHQLIASKVDKLRND